ncbi:nucleotidyltransferase family protein [Streptomyces sp. INA 01156]
MGLLLAAGGGRRLGGRPKALLTYRDGRWWSTPYGPCARAAASASTWCSARADEVRARAALPDCVLVDNPAWEQGMGSSLRAGLTSLTGADARVALVLLVDQPGIGPGAVARVLGARAAREPRESLASATYAGVRGHPVLFGAAHWAGVAASATGDRGHAPT